MTTANREPLLTVSAYSEQASRTDRFESETIETHFNKLIFGFFGEIGGLLSALKKMQRDQLQTTESQAAHDEIGDALWYLVNGARVCGVAADELGHAALGHLRMRFDERERKDTAPVTLRQLDALASFHHLDLEHKKLDKLREAGHLAGLLVSLDVVRVLAESVPARAQMFGQLLSQLVVLSASFELSLEAIAAQNLRKIADRWPHGSARRYVMPPAAGKGFEQFPARMEVKFEERRVGSRIVVVQSIKGLNIGDPLTDNSHKPDGYRYHDVFHLSYAVHLGWSPVIRALLKLKRKSDPAVDENEDGARAIIIEEGIATWIFNDAKRRKLYANIEAGRLDYALLRQVRTMVDNFHVAKAPLWQWELAILDGFAVFRQLYANRGGTVVANMNRHSLKYIPNKPLSEVVT